MKKLLFASLAVACVSANAIDLYDNGPVITHPGQASAAPTPA
ncbi:MAG: hypothetical protein ACR2HJ_08890 [Fimbriimonadales bacterium]